jgi:flagellar biosynthetic protein FliP
MRAQATTCSPSDTGSIPTARVRAIFLAIAVAVLALAGLLSPVHAHADSTTDNAVVSSDTGTTTNDTVGTTDPSAGSTPTSTPSDPTTGNDPVVTDPAPTTSDPAPVSSTTSSAPTGGGTTSSPAPTSSSTSSGGGTSKPTSGSTGSSSGKTSTSTTTTGTHSSTPLATASRATADVAQALNNSGLDSASTANDVNSVATNATNAIQAAANAANGVTDPTAGSGTPASTSTSTDPITQAIKNASKGSGSPLTIALLLGAISLVPAILMMGTAFTRIVIVLGFTRSALGTQNVPPNQVVIGLSLFLTLFVMGPTFNKVNHDAIQPMMKGKLTAAQAFDVGQKPVKDFMLKQVRQRDLGLFVKLSKQPQPKNEQSLSLTTIVPAFVISELRTAFLIGFLIFIPFLVIDLVVSAALSSLGMMMLPPVLISLPFKLLLFVAADGWYLVVQSLVQSFHT